MAEPVFPIPATPAPSTSGPDPDVPVIPITIIPTTPPTTGAPTTAAPTTEAPTTAAPTTAPPTTASPTTQQPTPAPTHRHHYSRIQQLEIDSSIVIGFLLVCFLAVLYKKRKRVPLYLMRVKYYLCCCRQSASELVAQQEEHATLNDFLFEVDRNSATGRVNMSTLTLENDFDDDAQTRMPPSVVEVSIQSIFPDILGQEMERQSQGSAREPLLPPGSGDP